jgi:hypothetical protein
LSLGFFLRSKSSIGSEYLECSYSIITIVDDPDALGGRYCTSEMDRTLWAG